MPQYQVAPYRITAKPAYSDGADTLLIENVDGREGKLLSQIAYTLLAAQGRARFQSPDRDVQYSVEGVTVGENIVLFQVVRGSTGVVSRIEKEGAEPFERDVQHRENVSYQCLAVFPRQGHHAFLLTEAMGNIGVATFVRTLLLNTLRDRSDHITYKIDPLATVADLDAAKTQVEAIKFRLPAPDDRGGKREGLSGANGYFTVNWHPRRKRMLKSFTGADGRQLEPSKVFLVLEDGLSAAGLSLPATRANELGVAASITVPVNGHSRSFQLGGAEGPSLVYAIESSKPGAASGYEGTERPDEEEFLTTCRRIMGDLAGQYDVQKSTASFCVRPETPTKVTVPDGWKAVWHDKPDSSTDR